jgi:lysophospholipase L1-like esterase
MDSRLATARPRRRRVLGPLVLLLVSTALTFALIEIGLRMTGLVHQLEVSTNPMWTWVVYDPVVARTNRAGDVQDQLGFRINALRFRGPEITVAKPPGTFRIVCLGDSTTFGIWNEAFLQVRGTTSYPGELAKLLAANHYDHVEVINAGVLGYTSAQGVAQLLAQVVRLRPDVVTVRFGNNDHGMRFGSEALPASTPLDYALLRWTPQWLLDTQTVRLAFHGFRRTHAGGQLPPGPRVVPPADFRRNLERIVSIAHAYGARVLFLDFPYRPLERGVTPGETFPNAMQDAKSLEELHATHAGYQDIVRDVARETDTPFLEMAPVLHARHREVFTDADMAHPNAAGYAVMGQLLFDELVRLGWLPPTS